jgi:hypothetical protein
MTGRHAATEDNDDEARSQTPQDPGAHRADPEPAPAAKPPGRRATKKEPS